MVGKFAGLGRKGRLPSLAHVDTAPDESNGSYESMSTFYYEFDELPLVITDTGIEGGMVNGRAEIQYTSDGEYQVNPAGIELEGFGPRDANGKRTWPYVAAPAAVAEIIVDRLELQWSDKVWNAVNAQIEENCLSAADDRADMMRERNEDDL